MDWNDTSVPLIPAEHWTSCGPMFGSRTRSLRREMDGTRPAVQIEDVADGGADLRESDLLIDIGERVGDLERSRP